MTRRSLLAFILAFALLPSGSDAQSPLQYELDASWPKPLPEKWITGQLGGVCTDAHDHIAVVNRRDITEEEQETGLQAPPILVFDMAGALVTSFGDPDAVPQSIHGCTFDDDNNIYVAGNGDGIVQKYSHDGELLLQIGTRGSFDSSDGTVGGAFLNASHDLLFRPPGSPSTPPTATSTCPMGTATSAWRSSTGRESSSVSGAARPQRAETQAGAPGVFANVVHCIAISRAGLVYVCDRQGDRVQVFDKSGTFVRNIWIRNGTPTLPDARGTAWWVAFSPDPNQRYLYVMNGRNETVHILNHESGEFWRPSGVPAISPGASRTVIQSRSTLPTTSTWRKRTGVVEYRGSDPPRTDS